MTSSPLVGGQWRFPRPTPALILDHHPEPESLANVTQGWRARASTGTGTSEIARPLTDTIIPRFLLRNVTWNLYEALYKELCDRSIRLNFDRRDLELMSVPGDQKPYTQLVDKLIRTLAQATATP